MLETSRFRLYFLFISIAIYSTYVKAYDINEQENTPIIAYYGTLNVDFWSKLSKGIRDQAKKRHAFILDYSQDDNFEPAKRIVFEKAIKNKVSGFILGRSPNEVKEGIDLLEKANIPVVLVNSDTSHRWVKSVIMADNKEAARIAAKYLHEQIQHRKKTGNTIIIISGDKAHPIAHIRAQASVDFFNEVGSYSIKTFYIDNWNGKKAFETARDQLNLLGEDVVGIFATYAPASIAITIAAKATNATPVLMGFDLNDSMKELIIKEELAGSVVQNPTLMGKKSIDVIFKVLNNETVERTIYLAPSLITKKHLQHHEF